MSIETFHLNIRAGLRARLMTLPGGLPDMAWENEAYSPKVGTPYIAETLIANSSRVRALGKGGNTGHQLLLTLTLNFPANTGTNPSDALAGKLLALFSPGTGIVYGGDQAMVQEAEKLGVQQQPDWIKVPVIITLTGYTQNL